MLASETLTTCMSDVRVVALDWTKPLPDAVANETFDVVLAADCVYWPNLFAPLLATLAALVPPRAGSPEASWRLSSVESRREPRARGRG